MDEKAKMESKLSSAAAFVEGGVQDACDDACSICLDAFCDSNPSTVTNCKHDYHLQCILEWCQRSSQCPMCWQPISMKDPMSQELLEAVEQERNMRANRSHSTALFRHPMLGDFEIPVGADDAELEERIIQHLAAAAAVRRSHRHHRRDGHHSRSGANSHPQVLVLSTDEHTTSGQEGDYEQAPAVFSGHRLGTLVQQERTTRGLEGAINPPLYCSTPADSNERIAGMQSTPVDQDRAGPSDLPSTVQGFYNQSASGWRERWFSRSNTISDISSEVRREVNAGIAAVSRMMERMDTRDGTGPSATSASGSGSH
ncbi:LOW QUALITY PROTEIN: E3 ubiquitin-protein ligase RHF2A [Setaria italica]|uniref:LOW QUALITY PROTEIN: E3 ubiquitin-protein ligase RHF2A n=1 Tax=Setaria italica TaxID=4555 RepID=UPI000BE5BBFC|nr:LOW QUALITY PROTEIN: E3 ubiquitin-protein ligase RHF2A [Setaria italica]